MPNGKIEYLKSLEGSTSDERQWRKYHLGLAKKFDGRGALVHVSTTQRVFDIHSATLDDNGVYTFSHLNEEAGS